MRLTDLDPRWINYAGRKGLGVSFRCMTGHCSGRVWVLFTNPIDGGPAWEGDCWDMILDLLSEKERQGKVYDRPCGKNRWTRTGNPPATTFETLSMTPSVNAHECGHLTLTNGVFG